MLKVMTADMSRRSMQAGRGLSDRKSFFVRHFKPALAQGLIERTSPSFFDWDDFHLA